MTTNPVFTVGHSTHSFERFISFLRAHEITAVTDVRSKPYSRIAPHFNRDSLERSLKQHAIKYVFLGAELGARSDDPQCYKEGRVQYRCLANTDLFRSGLERVIKGATSYRIALMCAEREPLVCHRTILVARALADMGVPIKHILANGTAESHDDAMERLLRLVGFSNQDLFKPHVELVAEALARQEERIAYTDDNLHVDRVAESI